MLINILLLLTIGGTLKAQQPEIGKLLPGDCLSMQVEAGNYLGLIVLQKSYPAQDTLFEFVLVANPFQFAPPAALFAIDSLWGQRRPVLSNADKGDALGLLLGGGKDFEASGEYRDELETIKLSASTLRSFLGDLRFHGHISIKLNTGVRVAHTQQLMTRVTLLDHVEQLQNGASWISKVAQIRTIKLPVNKLLASEGEPVRGEPPLDFDKFLSEAHPDFAAYFPQASWALDEPYAVFGTTVKRSLAEDFLAWKEGETDESTLAFIADLGVKRNIGLAYLLNAPEEYIREHNTDFLKLDQEVLTVLFTELIKEGTTDQVMVNVGLASAERLIVFKKYYDDFDIYPGFFDPEKMAEIATQYRDLLKQL